MRDPHVERLFYRLHTAETVTYENPPPVDYETVPFKAKLDQGQLTVEMKEHHPTAESASARAQEWLRAWEIDIGLTMAPAMFNLRSSGLRSSTAIHRHQQGTKRYK